MSSGDRRGRRLRHVNTAVGHGLSLRQSVLVCIELVRAITVLLGRVIEEPSAALKVGVVVCATTGGGVDAEKRLGEREFGDEGVGHGFAVGYSGTGYVHGAVGGGNVLRRRTGAIEGSVQGS